MKFDRRNDVNPKYLLLAFTIICVLCLILSYYASDFVVSLKFYTNRIISPIQKQINDIGVWTDSKMQNLQEIEKLNEENKKLKEELDTLKSQITIYQTDLSQLQSLQDLYKLDQTYPDYNKTAAHVFAKDSTSWFSVFYIDKGLDDGMFVGANVMCGDGLAGLIIECNKDYSKVRSIIDDNSNISAKVMPSNALCYVEGNLNYFQNGKMIVRNIDKDTKISIGDKVTTSHISDRYHPSITIGYVSDITYDSNNLTISATITPAVDFSNISEVLIITNPKESIVTK